MIKRLTHMSIYVLDQESAKRFYVEKLGFDLHDDQAVGGNFRWLTVGPKGHPGFKMMLIGVGPSPMMDEATASALRALIAQGAFWYGIFETDDCEATYQELLARGVEFKQKPTRRPYGLEAVLADDSGNKLAFVQP